MLSKEILIKRLALIKYLYKMGIEHSTQVETVASFSILMFHDSIEMFLKLIAEHHNIKSDKFNFIEYWECFPDMTLKESMKNLNARRVNIKHKGLLPSKSDIEISRVNTTDFFEQNTEAQCGIKFSEVSLLNLIQYVTVRDYLEKSENALSSGNNAGSIENSALAFHELLHLYENNKKGAFSGRSPFFFGSDFTFNSSFSMGIKDTKMADFVDKVKQSMDGIQTAVKIISLGVDYKRFAKFKLLTPVVTRTYGGKYVSEVWRKKKWTPENCQYCIEFVLDSAIKLQEFDFDIDEIEDEDMYQPTFGVVPSNIEVDGLDNLADDESGT